MIHEFILIAAAINRQYSAYRMPPPKTGGNGIVFLLDTVRHISRSLQWSYLVRSAINTLPISVYMKKALPDDL